MGYWAFGRRHTMTVHGQQYTMTPCAGVWGWARLYTPLWLPSFVDAVLVVLFPFVCRGVACNIRVLVLARGHSWLWCGLPPCLYLVLLAAARHTFCSYLLPMQVGVRGWACFLGYAP